MVTRSSPLGAGPRGYELAQLNLAWAKADLDDPLLADFMANLDRINALAEASPGFVWRLQSDSGNATDIEVEGDPRLVVNMSVWRDADALFDYVYKSAHTPIMARRREWFEKRAEAIMVLWWVPAGQRPSLEEAMVRLQRLNELGPTDEAFTFKRRFPAPDAVSREPGAFEFDGCHAAE